MIAECQMDRKDLDLFLKELGIKLNKEGSAIQLLARSWFGGSGEENEILRQSGIDLHYMGKQLLFFRGQLCQSCKMKEITVSMNFVDLEGKEEV